MTKKINPTSIYSFCVSWDELQDRMGKAQYKDFLKYMVGQTVGLHGVYIGDLARYFSYAKKGLKGKDMPLDD